MEISVIVPTRNRADELRKTLAGFSTIRKDGLSINYIIVDNGSTDNTHEVVKSYKNIDITYINDPVPGKSHALNMAIDSTKLGEIVVFTDDDVDPSPDWLIEVYATCLRWPSTFVFGGRIDKIFPDDCKIPSWAEKEDPFIDSFVFASQNFSDKECLYGPGNYPFGPNLWVRKEILEKGYRFNEKIGAGTGIMCEDVSFSKELFKDGYSIVYSPKAIVGHRIRPDLLKLRTLWSRGLEFGRSLPHFQGISRPNLFKKNKKLWQITSICTIPWILMKIPISLFTKPKEWIRDSVVHIAWARSHYESLRNYKSFIDNNDPKTG